MKTDKTKLMTQRELVYFCLAAGCQVMAIAAIFIGIFLPPKGEVHSSIITYFSVTSGFTGSLLGLTSWVKGSDTAQGPQPEHPAP